MRKGAALIGGLIGCLVTTAAHAEDTSSAEKLRTQPARRADFTLGFSGGLGLGRADGYPNEIQKIGDSAYRSDTKLAVGSYGLLWLGVAFNDYLTFGLGVGSFGLTGNDRDASAALFGFHVDAFPLFDLDKNLQDLALFANVGTGPLTIKGGSDQAEGGLLSYVEGGLAYERLRLWRIGVGPSVSLMHMWSESAQLTGALVGVRLAFYGGP